MTWSLAFWKPKTFSSLSSSLRLWWWDGRGCRHQRYTERVTCVLISFPEKREIVVNKNRSILFWYLTADVSCPMRSLQYQGSFLLRKNPTKKKHDQSRCAQGCLIWAGSKNVKMRKIILTTVCYHSSSVYFLTDRLWRVNFINIKRVRVSVFSPSIPHFIHFISKCVAHC